ncbi:MAG: cyclophilin-like fold protein [Candidatus Thorarchaeota archaeon SMTZ1-83]
MTQTDLLLEFDFEGGTILHAVMERVNAPLILEEVKVKLPIEGRAALIRNEMQITLGIGKGNVKPTKEVKRGDVAYMPLGDNLCIYLEDMTTFSQVTVLGRITSDHETLETLKSVRRGAAVEIRFPKD